MAMQYLRILVVCCGMASLAIIAQMVSHPASRCPPRLAAFGMTPSPPCEDKAPDGTNANGCLQQAIWGKCNEDFMAGRCDKSCARCSSSARTEALKRLLVVSARQAAPCTSPDGDAWVMRAQQNKAEYARVHGMSLSWTSAQVDPQYDGAWNKLGLLMRIMNQSLERRTSRAVATNGSNRHDAVGSEWLLWVDWDIVFTDLSFVLPLEEYESLGVRLVLGGEPKGVYEDVDYLKLNTGMMLLRVHSWSLALLRRMLEVGRKTARRRHALDAQRVVKNLCIGCIDDQAVLLMLLHDQPTRWKGPTLLERRYMLQGYWEDYEEALPISATAQTADGPGFVPLRLVGAPRLPPLKKAVFGREHVPFSIHFAGCQLCSGKAAPERARRCWPAFRRTVRFAEDQTLRPMGLQHALRNRSEPLDLPLEPRAIQHTGGARTLSDGVRTSP